MSTIPTIKIQGGEGEPDFLIINADDFDESIHTAYVEPVAKATKGTNGDSSDDSDTDQAPSEAKLLKMRKGELVAIAEEAGLEIVPDEETIVTLAKKIVEAQEAKTDE